MGNDICQSRKYQKEGRKEGRVGAGEKGREERTTKKHPNSHVPCLLVQSPFSHHFIANLRISRNKIKCDHVDILIVNENYVSVSFSSSSRLVNQKKQNFCLRSYCRSILQAQKLMFEIANWNKTTIERCQ